jgi:hypothetical protein
MDWARFNDLMIDLSAPKPARRVHVDRFSWEAQLLATLQATSARCIDQFHYDAFDEQA